MTWCVFRLGGARARAGLRIGDSVLDLTAARAPYSDVLNMSSLNAFMALGRVASHEVLDWARNVPADHPAMIPAADVTLEMPVTVGDYTDFYASIYHATNVGSMFRPDNPLLPNYKYVPIAYHGRASSIVPSGTPVRRPCGQLQDGDAPPRYAPSRLLDYELELGAFIGAGNRLGEPVPIAEAEQHIFGLCLVNDWSARDIQRWEYQPLGPFLAKNFATSISRWIVPLETLEPFRVPAFTRPEGDPQPLPYLRSEDDQRRGAFDITVEAWIETEAMRSRGIEPFLVSRGNVRDMYWTFAQMMTHHACGGCNLRPGDLIASGTVSGAERESAGCLLERTWRGAQPLELPSGETRRFLEDGDEVILRGYCERETVSRVDFGECRGRVLPARCGMKSA
ncbi:MAG TPA: fumarylacetoacetase [Bryobacteraceae bacterium]|nr:fumarylacetoacetase [Bryobacteraceae bacterium]